MTTTTETRTLDELCVNTIRTLSMDAVQKANSGHPGAPMGLAPLAYVLYTRVMRHNPNDPDWADRDRFVLSAGHASMLLYSMLHLTGYPLTLEDIESFRQVGSPTAGHPERKYTPGIEATTGPLGQGLAMSVGLALAERMLAARFNADGHEIVDHHTFVIASDGDMQEGVAAEASSFAGHLGLGRLIVFYDDNKIQLASPVDEVSSEDVGKRYEAYGWHVEDVGDNANDLDRLEQAARSAMEVEDRPSLILVRTHIGFGSPNKQDSTKAHGSPLGDDEVRLTKEALGWDPDAQFLIPDEALAHFRRCCDRGRELQDEWTQRYEAYRQAHADRAQLFETIQAGGLPDGWEDGLPRFELGEDMASRQASGKAIQWAAKGVPHLIGGSADLASSTNTDIDDGGDVQRDSFDGRNLRFGVREHGMGAIVNGLALHGFRAFGATFLQFYDYMKAAVRLSALMKLPAIWVYTHDSIGLGEDGPTHQPIEQLAGARAVPRLNVVRPADANETALGWRFALRSEESPTLFALSRQGLPNLDPDAIPDDAIERGAYVLRDAGDGEPDLILIGTGSEVSLCMEAVERLEGEGIATRVVSMPCMDTFAEADEAYRDEVLPPGCRARIAVEAAARLGWDRWIGPDGAFLGMETYGESGPAKEVYAHFGITADRLVELGKEVTERVGVAR